MPYDVIHRSVRTKACFAQGDMHDAYAGLRDGTFDLVVLCAEELEEMFAFYLDVHPQLRKRAHFAPNDDGVLNRKRIDVAVKAANVAAKVYKRGERVLVTCQAGRNRSGLVNALALHLVSGISGREAAQIVQAKRVRANGPALSNDHFVEFLRRIPEKRGARGGAYFAPATTGGG